MELASPPPIEAELRARIAAWREEKVRYHMEAIEGLQLQRAAVESEDIDKDFDAITEHFESALEAHPRSSRSLRVELRSCHFILFVRIHLVCSATQESRTARLADSPPRDHAGSTPWDRAGVTPALARHATGYGDTPSVMRSLTLS